MKFCYIDKIEKYPLSEPIKNALNMTIDKLKQAGHIVEKIDVENWKEPNWQSYLDNNKYIISHILSTYKDTLHRNFLSNESYYLDLIWNLYPIIRWLIVQT